MFNLVEFIKKTNEEINDQRNRQENQRQEIYAKNAKIADLVMTDWPKVISLMKSATLDHKIDGKQFFWTGDSVTLGVFALTFRISASSWSANLLNNGKIEKEISLNPILLGTDELGWEMAGASDRATASELGTKLIVVLIERYKNSL